MASDLELRFYLGGYFLPQDEKKWEKRAWHWHTPRLSGTPRSLALFKHRLGRYILRSVKIFGPRGTI